MTNNEGEVDWQAQTLYYQRIRTHRVYYSLVRSSEVTFLQGQIITDHTRWHIKTECRTQYQRTSANQRAGGRMKISGRYIQVNWTSI